MKFFLPFTIIAIILINLSAKAQYNQLLLSNHKWIVKVNNQGSNYREEYRIDSDTTISNQNWKKIIMISDTAVNPSFHIKFFMREDTVSKRIYVMNPGQLPHLYFDFSASINDTITLYNPAYNIIDTFYVKNISYWMTPDSIYRKVFTLYNLSIPTYENWIEGVGSLYGIYYGNRPPYLYSFNKYELEVCCKNTEIIYSSPDLIFGGICNLNIGISEFKRNEFVIYPNPASDFIKIENITFKTLAEIYTIDGKLQKSVYLSENGRIKISDLAQGIYIIKLQTETGVIYRKFIKQ